MRFIPYVFLLTFSFLAVNVNAQQATPMAGNDYVLLDKPQSTDAGKKVEVIEFFGYFCPGCNAFEPYLTDWIKKQGDRIVLKRVHVDFHQMVTQQKLYFTLDAMGIAEQYQVKAFNAYHIDRNRLSTDAEVMKFIEKQSIDQKKFLGIYKSFSIQAKVNRAPQLQSAYRIDTVPNVVINGRYVVSPAQVAAKNRNQPSKVHPGIAVMDWLVNKSYLEKNAVMAPRKK